VRRLAALLLVAAMAAACQQADTSRPRAAKVFAFSEPDPLPPKPVYRAPARPHWKKLPDGSRVLFPGHRVIAFYGAPHAPGLGVLGAGTPDGIWPRLRRQAKPYATTTRPVVPAYELITFLATGSRGNQGNFSSRLSNRTIDQYARAAKRHHGLLILDIQPGRGQFLTDARRLAPWLRLPYVGLAIDPEWKLYGSQLPLSGIGHTSAHVVNHLSRWLDHLTRANHLPQKLLLVHQFTDSMVTSKAHVVGRRHLAVVFNVDGLGGRAAKIGKYRDFARDRRFPLGFKVFYDADTDLMSPADVLRLRPRPVIVEYE
jgi:hypothetical protein